MGGNLQLGAKAWDNSSSLARFNALDYPFALLRWITGTDQSFEPYGATLPTLVLGLDHVRSNRRLSTQKYFGEFRHF